MDQKQRKATTTLVNGQTQYVSVGGATGAKCERMNMLSWTVDHPGPGTTTAYTIQRSNLTDLEASLGQDDWHDDGSAVNKTAAEKFGLTPSSMGYSRYRLKAVTSLGGAAVTVREQRKSI